MAAKNQVFPTTVAYQKEQFDPSLQLQRIGDTSKQAMQPFQEKVAAIQTQALIDSKFNQFRDALAETELKNQEREKTFLQKLAPFSPIINEQLQAIDKAWDERRTETINDMIGERQLALRDDPAFQNVTDDVNGMLKRAADTGRIDILNKISKLDWGAQARVNDGWAKAAGKKETYKNDWTAYKASGKTLDLGGSSFTVNAMHTTEQVQAALADFEAGRKALIGASNLPPDVWSSYMKESRVARQEVLNEENTRVYKIEGIEQREVSKQSLLGGAKLTDVTKRIGLSADGDSIFTMAKAYTEVQKHIVDGIKNGTFNYQDITRWKSETHPVTGQPLAKTKQYKPMIDAFEKAFFDKQKKDKQDEDYLLDIAYQNWSEEFLRKVITGEITITEEQITNELLPMIQIKFKKLGEQPLIKALRNGLSVDDRTFEVRKEDLFARLKAGQHLDTIELVEYGQKLFTDPRVQALNKANKEKQGHSELIAAKKRAKAYVFESRSAQGGGMGVKFIPNAKDSPTALVILSEVDEITEQVYNDVLTRARPEDRVFETGMIGTMKVQDLVYNGVLEEIAARTKDPTNRLYYNAGQYPNVNMVKQADGKYLTPANAATEMAKLAQPVAQLAQVQKETGLSYLEILQTPEHLSKVFPKQQVQQFKTQLENGQGMHPALIGMSALLIASPTDLMNQLTTTHQLESVDYSKAGGAEPKLPSNFNMEETLTRMKYFHQSGNRQQQRISQSILGGMEAVNNPSGRGPSLSQIALQYDRTRAVRRTLTEDEAMELIQFAGFPEDRYETINGKTYSHAEIMLAVLKGESGLDIGANTNESGLSAITGEDSLGFIQGNWAYHGHKLSRLGWRREMLYDPVVAILFAKFLYDGRQGSFGDWGAYTDGAYLQHLR